MCECVCVRARACGGVSVCVFECVTIFHVPWRWCTPDSVQDTVAAAPRYIHKSICATHLFLRSSGLGNRLGRLLQAFQLKQGCASACAARACGVCVCVCVCGCVHARTWSWSGVQHRQWACAKCSSAVVHRWVPARSNQERQADSRQPTVLHARTHAHAHTTHTHTLRKRDSEKSVTVTSKCVAGRLPFPDDAWRECTDSALATVSGVRPGAHEWHRPWQSRPKRGSSRSAHIRGSAHSSSQSCPGQSWPPPDQGWSLHTGHRWSPLATCRSVRARAAAAQHASLTLSPRLVGCNNLVNDGRVFEPLLLRLSKLHEWARAGRVQRVRR